jgi:TRAP-type uncharacterized transport system substrate-binding protein
MRRRLLHIAAGLVAVATLALVTHAFFSPKVLRVAVGPVGSSDVRVIVGYLQALQRERAGIRFKLVMTDGSASANKALETRKADLAVARADIGLPANSATVAILRRDAILLITRPGLVIEKIADLRDKTIGGLVPAAANERLLNAILAQHDVAPNDMLKIFGSFADMMSAAHEGRIDAMFLVNPATDRAIRAFFGAFPKIEGQQPGLLPIGEAEALVEQNPAYDTYEIVRGAFGANPAIPEENATTLAVTHRLVARRDLSEQTVSELTRLLVTLRLQVAQEVPAANQIELPSTDDRAAKLPTHPGTIAYVEGETRTFFERYGDFIYIGVMVVSLLGSAAAALVSTLMGRRSPVTPDSRLKDLLRLTQDVNEAASIEELSWIEAESRDVMRDLMASLGEKEVDAGRIAAISFLSTELRRAMSERRVALMPQAAE